MQSISTFFWLPAIDRSYPQFLWIPGSLNRRPFGSKAGITRIKDMARLKKTSSIKGAFNWQPVVLSEFVEKVQEITFGYSTIDIKKPSWLVVHLQWLRTHQSASSLQRFCAVTVDSLLRMEWAVLLLDADEMIVPWRRDAVIRSAAYRTSSEECFNSCVCNTCTTYYELLQQLSNSYKKLTCGFTMWLSNWTEVCLIPSWHHRLSRGGAPCGTQKSHHVAKLSHGRGTGG